MPNDVLSKPPREIYDPFAREMHVDPYGAYRILRDELPLYYNAERDFYALSRSEDVQAASRDWEAFSSSGGVDPDAANFTFGAGEGSFIDMDPPRHDLLRRLVREPFTPRGIERLATTVSDELELLLPCFRAKGGGDWSQELAIPLSVAVTSRLLGLPRDDQPQLIDWSQRSIAREPDTSEIPAAAIGAARELQQYFASYLEGRQKSHSGGLLEVIASDQTAVNSLSTEASAGLMLSLFVASTQTTAGFLAMSLLVLAEHPDSQRFLVDNSAHIPRAIEELLRFESPVQNSSRIATREVAFHNETIPSRARVLLLYGAANRDDRRFARPDEFDLFRAPRRHLAFGEGIHFCLGAPLARLEGRVVLQWILTEAPSYRIAGEPERLWSHTTRTFSSLPIEF